MKDGDRFIIHEFFVCEESKNAIVADFYIKKQGCSAALSTRAEDGDAGSVDAGHIIIGTPALFFCSSHHDSLGLGSTLLCSSSLLHKISQPIMS